MGAGWWRGFPGPAPSALLVAGVLGCASARSSGSEDDSGLIDDTGFHERSMWPSTVLHLEQEEIVAAEGITELVLEVPGIFVGPGPRNTWSLMRVKEASGDTCALSAYLNGYRLDLRSSGFRLGLDSFLTPTELDALELHIGPSGPVFDENDCGSLLLWSHRHRSPSEPPFRGSIQGHIHSAAPDTVIQIRLHPGESAAVPGANGEFSFLGLRPGLYTLTPVSPGGPISPHSVRVYAHEVSRVEMNVRR